MTRPASSTHALPGEPSYGGSGPSARQQLRGDARPPISSLDEEVTKVGEARVWPRLRGRPEGRPRSVSSRDRVLQLDHARDGCDTGDLDEHRVPAAEAAMVYELDLRVKHSCAARNNPVVVHDR